MAKSETVTNSVHYYKISFVWHSGMMDFNWQF